MSLVITTPAVVAAAASDLAGIGSAVGIASAMAAAPTTGLLAAGADEISAAVAVMFGAHAPQYQALSAQAAAFNDQFMRVLNAAAGAYASAEATNVQQVALATINAPTQAIFGRPLIGDGSNAATPGASGGAGGILFGNGGNGAPGAAGQAGGAGGPPA